MRGVCSRPLQMEFKPPIVLTREDWNAMTRHGHVWTHALVDAAFRGVLHFEIWRDTNILQITMNRPEEIGGGCKEVRKNEARGAI